MKRNHEIETNIAKLVYRHETELLDTGFGLTLYLVDKKGEQTGQFCLLGGGWQEARNKEGVIEKRWIRVCPAWTINLLDAWDLLHYCNKQHPENFVEIRQRLRDFPLDKPAAEVALIIAKAIIEVYNNA
jgi:hypothetical protein